MTIFDETYGECAGCGGAWFELQPPDDAEEIPEGCGPAVCVSPTGAITGYAGKLVCIECGTDFTPGLTFRPTRSHLRVVE